jgi:hypothetical protein
MPSHAHLFYSTKKVFQDKGMEGFAKSVGDCTSYRVCMGSTLDGGTTEFGGCCNICSTHSVSSRLDIFGIVATSRRRQRRAVRKSTLV